jgi:hypothetical protein
MLKLYASLSGAALALSLATSVALAQRAIATADGELPGFRIDITELKRTSGDTVTMKFTLINESEEQLHVRDVFSSRDVSGVHLIHAAGKKKYLTIKDASNPPKCVCSGEPTRYLEAGKSVNLWAQFPAPAADVQVVSVVFPHFIPTDAPISE